MRILSDSITTKSRKHPSFGTRNNEEFFEKVNNDVLTLSRSNSPKAQEAAKKRIFASSDEQIRNTIKKYPRKFYDISEAYQDLMLNFLEMLENLKNDENPMETFTKFFQKLKPASDSKLPQDKKTINKRIFDDSSLTFADRAVETFFDHENSLEFSAEEKEIREKTITNLLKNPENNPNDIKILSLHFNKQNPKLRISETARKVHRSATQTKNYINRAIAHLQNNSGTLPDEAKKFISDFKKYFPETKLNTAEILNIYVKDTFLQPSKAAENVKIVADYYKSPYLTTKTYSDQFKYFPSLYFQQPQKTIQNIDGVIKSLEKYGLTKEKYLKALNSQPQYYQKPEKIVKNITGLAQIYGEYGMTIEKAVSSALKFPRLFFQNPETPGKKAAEMEKIFKKEGLTYGEYIKAMIKSPVLFGTNTEHAAENIKTTAKLLENTGLTLKNFIEIAMKQPLSIAMRPELISEHIKLIQYIRKDDRAANGLAPMTQKELVKASSSAPLAYSKENNFMCLLNKKIARCLGESCLKNINLKETLPQRIAECNAKSFRFDIVDGEFAQEFIDFVQNFSIKHLGKNIFKINITPELKDCADFLKYLK